MPASINNSNQSVGKAMQIIEVMAQSNIPMRLQDISKAVSMPASTALRMITALMEYRYIQQNPEDLKYSLTLKFAKLGAIVSSRLSLRDSAHPFLAELSIKCKEAVSVAIEDNMQVTYIDVIDGPDGLLKITQYIGKQSPIHCTGVGKCLMLNYSNEQIDKLIAEKGLPGFTPNTITTRKDLAKELDIVRARGYAVDDQECELGVRCVAAGIRDYTGKVVAAVSVSGPINRMTIEYLEAINGVVVRTAQEISMTLLA